MDIQITQDDLNKIKQYKRYKNRVEEIIEFFNDIANGDYTVERINEFISAQNNLLTETNVPAKITTKLITEGANTVMDLSIVWDKDYAEQMVKYAIVLETE